MVAASTAASSDILVEPSLLTEDDIPWLVGICKRRYSDIHDPVTTEGWFRNIVLKQPVLFLPQRMPNAFCISMLSILPWLPAQAECNIVFICADDGAMWEAMKLLRASIAWGKARRCTTWKMSSDSEYELGAMAKRLGATEVSPRYVLRY